MYSRRALKLTTQTPRRGAQSISLGATTSRASADAILLIGAALLALSVFELAAWLAAAELATLVYSVALVPLALFATALVSSREP